MKDDKLLDSQCKQCGECCRKGGPLLHLDDMPLVREGHINFDQLVTLRKGELAYNAVHACLSPLDEEVIKIIGTNDPIYPWHCVLHAAHGCSLHPLRPAQCAALSCQNTTALTDMYEVNRATRKDVLAFAPKHWLELALAYEEQNSFHLLIDLAAQFEKSQSEILNTLHYDMAYRELCTEKAKIPKTALDCVLGRSFNFCLNAFGLELRRKNNNYIIIRVAKSYYQK